MPHPEPGATNPLQRLCARHGIAWTWQDVFGRVHEVPESSLRALLKAAGAPADTDEDVATALTKAERDLWQRVLPPVVVVRETALPASTVLRLPRADRDQHLELYIEREDGTRESRTVEPFHLEQIDAAIVDGTELVALRLPLPAAPLGYHHVRIARGADTLAGLMLVVVPERCYEPEVLRGTGRVWGPGVQVYALRSKRNWGIGDFTDLQTVLEQWAARGAALVGTNPLHALFPHRPEQASPYSPSSRLFLNVLYIDPERVEDFSECEAARRLVGSAQFQERLQALRAQKLVDYPAVAQCKLRVLEMLYESFRSRHAGRDSARARAFEHFRQRGGMQLELHATYEALQERFHREDPRCWGWPVWPSEYRNPDSPAVARFRTEQRERIEFYQYLQWQADEQLGAVGRRALELNIGIGLYGDLAVSMDRGGAESWAAQSCLAGSVSVGAPPDEFNPAGQNWGLPPLVPRRLVDTAYAPFIALLRAAMRYNGALRIDHVMGLERLYWIPAGASPADGAYVSYPLDDMLGIVALESHRNACVVVGEDLGTVSERIREAMDRYGMLSCRLLYFERNEDGSYKAPADYPVRALAAVTNHDLPTVAGFWEGWDLLVRHELGQFPSEEHRQQQIVGRAQARAHLLLALEREGLLPEGVTVDPMSVPSMTSDLALALHVYLARAPAKLLVVQLDDVIGAVEQVNVPGTTEDRYPNWRRKLDIDLEDLARDERLVRFSVAIERERPAPPRAMRHAPMRGPRANIPRATYRLQLNASFTFRDAAALVPYLAELGISHIYCSPYFRARPGSTHGYDIVDHNAFNPEIGAAEDFEHLVATLREHGLGQILDMVPNHVGIMGADNAWWLDVLENGQASIYAPFFDIDWQPANPVLRGKVLTPVLGDPYGVVLERGELELRFERETGSFAVWYHQHRFPLNPRTYPAVLERALQVVSSAELESLCAAFRHLPTRDDLSPERITERNRDKEFHKRRLAALCEADHEVCEAVEAAVRALRGSPGDPSSFDALHELLERQPYRLAYWRVASDDINYRRFFDVNDLAALRMDNEAVFEATHRLVLDLLAEGKVDGLRIDHPDGLYDPAQYFSRLQERVAAMAGATLPAALPENDRRELPLYLVVEKITAGFERLPTSWPVHGTTGYRFANMVNGLLVDASAKSRMERIYRSFTGTASAWSEVVYEAKRHILDTSLAAELNVLANQLVRIAQSDRRTRDFTLNSLREALAEVIACFPVYRTYVAEGVSADDRRYIEWAISSARRRRPATDPAIFDFVRAVLMLEVPAGNETVPDAVRSFAMKFQQVTAPVTAKGVEDTALYRFNRLVSLNEVGGEPDSFGVSVSAFHADAQHRARQWPHELLATSTHDTKRSEDVRARIDVLSEMPGEWRAMVERWHRMNRSRRREVDGRPAPSADDEYLLYQTLVGSWPLEELDEPALAAYTERIEAYMIKAAREAKRRTSWSSTNAEYEDALRQFIRAALEPREGNLFLAEMIAARRRIARFGLYNGLSQTLCKLTAPGVPDIYQGNELWDFSLVDPDNRRPVDYDRRRTLLAGIRSLSAAAGKDLAGQVRSLTDSLEDGRGKLYLTWRCLQLRRARSALFDEGDYLPLRTTGERSAHLCAFARRRQHELVVVLVPRLYARLLGDREEPPLGRAVWGDTSIELPRRVSTQALENVLDGARIRLQERNGRRFAYAGDVLASFPVGLLATPVSAEEVRP